jgi:hypothetical protein
MEYYDLYKDDIKFSKYIYKLNFKDYDMWGFYRPDISVMINNLVDYYNLSVWSAGVSEYVKTLSNNIFNNINLKFIWSRDKCYDYYDLNAHYNYLKKPITKVFDNYNKMNYKNTIIIDDRYDVSSDNIFNHIHIPKYNFKNIDISNKNEVYNYIINDNAIKLLNNHLIINNNKNINKIANIYFK